MIVYKEWRTYKAGEGYTHNCEGWFLFGFIPLYIRRWPIR